MNATSTQPAVEAAMDSAGPARESVNPTPGGSGGESGNSGTSEQQYVLFTIGDEAYGVEIGAVHGIIMPQAVTEVPKTPSYVRGVTNLRGTILPVIDMRMYFGLEPTPGDVSRHIRFVVVDTHSLTAALIVDAVSEVARLSPADIEAPSQLLSSEVYDCIRGVGKLPVGEPSGKGDKRLVMLLDVDVLLERGLTRMARAA